MASSRGDVLDPVRLNKGHLPRRKVLQVSVLAVAAQGAQGVCAIAQTMSSPTTAPPRDVRLEHVQVLTAQSTHTSRTSSGLPTAANVDVLGFASGRHPRGLLATFEDAHPARQPWNPFRPEPGPWFNDHNSVNSWGELWAFCAPTWVPSLRMQVLAWGSGHTACNVPAPVAYDLNTHSVRWLTVPPPSDGFSSVKGKPGQATVENLRTTYPAAQLDPVWKDWQGGFTEWAVGFSRPGAVYPEGTHTRAMGVWVPGEVYGNVHGALMQCGESTGTCNSSDGQGGSHFFDLDSNRFVRARSRRKLMGYVGAACWSSAINRVVCLGAPTSRVVTAVELFDPAPGAQRWITRQSANGVLVTADGSNLVEHPPSGLLMMFTAVDSQGRPSSAHANTMQVSAVAARACLTDGAVWSPLSVHGSGWPQHRFGSADNSCLGIGFTFVPDLNAFYALNGQNGSRVLWKLQPPAGASTVSAHLNGAWTLVTKALASGLRCHGQGGADHQPFIYSGLGFDRVSNRLILVSNDVRDQPMAIEPI